MKQAVKSLLSSIVLMAFGIVLIPARVQAAEPVTLIWPAPPGGGGDLYFRILGKVIEQRFGVPLVVMNVSGGGGAIGVAKMVASKPDGKTVAGVWTGPISIAPHTLGVSYKPSDYVPVMEFSSAPYAICVAAEFPAQTTEQFVEALKRSPDKYTFGTDGPGGMGQLAATRIFMDLGIKQRDVPYKGAGESSVALLGKHVDMYVGTIPTILPHVKSGAVKCMLVTSAKRQSTLPSTAGLEELGIPQDETLLWRAIIVPRGTPEAEIENLERMFEAAARAPESMKFLDDAGETLAIVKGPQLSSKLDQEYRAFERVVQAAGMTKTK